MAATKIILIVIFCAACTFVPIESAKIIHKVTGFLTNKAENVGDSLKDAVQGLFHPHRDRQQESPNNNPNYHSGSESSYPQRSSGWRPSYSHNSPGQSIFRPQNPSGDDSYYPGSPGRSTSSPYFPTWPGSTRPSGYNTGSGNTNPGYGTQQNSVNPTNSNRQESPNPNYPTGQNPTNQENNQGYGSSNSNYPREDNSPLPSSGTQQGTYNPNNPPKDGSTYSGQGSSDPTNPSEKNNNLVPADTGNKSKYDVDIRNSETGVANNSAPAATQTQGPNARSLLAFKGCPEGERKDPSGKCRTVS